MNEKKKFKVNQIKKGNLWYPPTKSLYKFLDLLKISKLPQTIAILGCADGNYVIPAAKRGFRVLAIDIDKIALYGGHTSFGGKTVQIVGLKKKLERYALVEKVTVVHDNYFEYKNSRTYSGVIATESTHYQINSNYTLKERVERIKNFVSPNGMLMFEYLHLSARNCDTKRFLSSKQLRSYFPEQQWNIVSNKKKTYIEDPNPRTDEVHEVILGRLYARRKL